MDVFQRYAELPEEEKEEVFVGLLQNKQLRTGFVCPILDVPLNVPCSLEDCGNHIENEWAKNCILCYMHKEELQTLSPTEVAYLLRVPEDKVITLYNDQMRKVRRKYLEEELLQENAIRYLKNVEICCVCEHKTNSDIIRDGLRFCSVQCLKRRPLFIFQIEKEYGRDIETIIKTAMNLFKTVDIVESLFEISRKKIEYIIRNFANDLSEQFFNMIISDKDFLIRKERKFIPCLKMLTSMGTRRRQFGTPKESLEVLFNEFNAKLVNI